MKRCFSGAALALAISAGSAVAVDLPSNKAAPAFVPPPPPSWTGGYIGLSAGYTWTQNDSVTTTTGPVFDAKPGGYATTTAILGTFSAPTRLEGFIGGGQAGYNHELYSKFVLGLEADIQGLSSSAATTTVTSAAFNPIILGGSTAAQASTITRSLDYFGTVRGRLGYAVLPNLLVYGTGGLAYGGASARTSIFFAYPPASGAGDIAASGFAETRTGWTAGGGLEWMFMAGWSAKVEYLHYDLGSVSYSVGPMVSVTPVKVHFVDFGASSVNVQGHIVRAGLNYHFELASPIPVLAKF